LKTPEPTSPKLYSQEAEASLVGGILIDPDRLPDVRNLVAPEMFCEDTYRLVWEAVLSLADEDAGIDVMTVMDRLEQDGHLPGRISMAAVVTLAQDTPSAANVKYYARIVAKYAKLRRLQDLGALVSTWTRPDAKPEDIAGKIREYLDSEDIGAVGVGPQPLGECITKTLEILDERAKRGPGMTGLPTGLPDLDDLLDGLCPGRLYVIAARPGMGKSIMGLQFARCAVQAGSSAAVWTLEMPYDEYVTRLFAAEKDIPYRKIQLAQLSPQEWGDLSDVAQQMNDARMWIDDSESLPISELLARARTLHRLHGIGLVVVDYLGLIVGQRNLPREREVSEIVKSLKGLAKKLGIPVVLLAQLNRTLESRTDKRPVLSDSRESGEIEQTADVVIMLYRDEIYNPNSADKGYIEILIRKQRAGALGMIPGKFLGALSRIEPIQNLPSQAGVRQGP
jgi:replicative DNA helicase